MQVKTKTTAADAAKTDLLVLVISGDAKTLAFPDGYAEAANAARAAGDLPRDFRSTCALYPAGKANAKRTLVISAGDAPTTEKLRRVAAIAVQHAKKVKAKDCVLGLDDSLLVACKDIDDERLGRALGEGLVLGAYGYVAPSGKKAEAVATKNVQVAARGGKLRSGIARGVDHGALRGASTCYARDLANRAGNLITPTKLAAEAKKLAGPSIRYKALNEAQMEKLGMGSLLSVSRGSSEEARMIVLEYTPKSSGKSTSSRGGTKGKQQTLLVVGKGLTFDAGGLSLKPAASMDEMRYDKCGGVAVLGLFHAIQSGAVTPKHRVIGVVPASENLPDGNANKPGDIVTACNGTTIEVLNTDAEGRLILCDALAWAIKAYEPDACVDLATLTGACIVALGHELSGAMGNDQKLIDEILDAGRRADDPCWQLPLLDVHKEQMKGTYADLKNINSPKDGNGSTAGGAFLSYFVGDTPWVHLDIAGTAWNQKAKDYYQSGGSGAGVRVLIEWVESR